MSCYNRATTSGRKYSSHASRQGLSTCRWEEEVNSSEQSHTAFHREEGLARLLTANCRDCEPRNKSHTNQLHFNVPFRMINWQISSITKSHLQRKCRDDEQKNCSSSLHPSAPRLKSPTWSKFISWPNRNLFQNNRQTCLGSPTKATMIAARTSKVNVKNENAIWLIFMHTFRKVVKLSVGSGFHRQHVSYSSPYPAWVHFGSLFGDEKPPKSQCYAGWLCLSATAIAKENFSLCHNERQKDSHNEVKRIASNLHAQACQKCRLMRAGLSVFSDSACQVKFLVLHDVRTAALMDCRWHRPKIEAPNKLRVPSSYLCRNLLSLRMVLCSGQEMSRSLEESRSLTRPTLGVSSTNVSVRSILQRLPSDAKVLKATMWSMPQLRRQSFKCSLSSHLKTVTTLPTKNNTNNQKLQKISSLQNNVFHCIPVIQLLFLCQLTPFCFSISPSTPSSDSLGQSEFSRVWVFFWFFFGPHDEWLHGSFFQTLRSFQFSAIKRMKTCSSLQLHRQSGAVAQMEKTCKRSVKNT